MLIKILTFEQKFTFSCLANNLTVIFCNEQDLCKFNTEFYFVNLFLLLFYVSLFYLSDDQTNLLITKRKNTDFSSGMKVK